MKALVIGGREFLGRHIVDSLVDIGAEITLFNRGKTNPHLYRTLETILGDRTSDLARLRGRKWDVVIDTCGYDPRNVSKVASVLSENVDHYIYISSASVYEKQPTLKMRSEEAQFVNTKIDYKNIDPQGKDYGACKYLSEKAIEKNFRGLVTIVRAGLIVGPYDTTARFPYWIKRLCRGGPTLAPPYDYPTQFIDARDLAEWCAHVAKNKIHGAFNALGPKKEVLSVGEFLEVANSTLGGRSDLVFASEDFLEKHRVKCWTELPLWVVEEVEAFMLLESDKAVASGLKFRDIRSTVLETLDWLESEDVDLGRLKYDTLSSRKELEILSADFIE